MREAKCKIVIWGAGYWGEKALQEMDTYGEFDNCSVIAFADNDPSKQGKSFHGYNVIALEDVVRMQEDIDAIFIAASKYYDIEKQLLSRIKIPIYFAFQRASIDITGWCNAKCKWCSTGRKNRNGMSEKIFMNFETFASIYKKMRETKVLFPMNELLLYNWGEPFLNPDYMRIINYLNSEKQRFSISTNASVVKYAEENEYQFCDTVVFSLSGFTQDSYNRIHGFDLERIKSNIQKLIKNMREHGFKGRAKLSFHVYKFNETEVDEARKFAESLDIEFVPILAYFASYSMAIDYLKNTLSKELQNDARNELILSHVKPLIAKRPEDFHCPVENMISVNTFGQIELCCCSDAGAENYCWGSIDNLTDYVSWKKFRNNMLKCNTCNECRNLGVDYWFFNNPEYKSREVIV